jgi:hypothetical protein
MASRTVKQIFAGQKRSLASIQKRLEALAAEWDEVDNGTMWGLQQLADKVEVASNEIQEFVK